VYVTVLLTQRSTLHVQITEFCDLCLSKSLTLKVINLTDTVDHSSLSKYLPIKLMFNKYTSIILVLLSFSWPSSTNSVQRCRLCEGCSTCASNPCWTN